MSARSTFALIYHPKVRSIGIQLALCALIVFLAYAAIQNAAENLTRAKVASGFKFWDSTAGFDINQTLIEYTHTSTYGRAFWVGLLNTLLVAGLGHRAGDHPRLCHRARATCRGIGSLRGWPASMSRSSVTCRCCCNCCSGTTPSSKRCPSGSMTAGSSSAGFSTGAACSCRSRWPGKDSARLSLRSSSGSLRPSRSASGRADARRAPARVRLCFG